MRQFLTATALLALLATPALAKKKRKGQEGPLLPPIPEALSLPADRAPVYADVTEAPAMLGSNIDITSLSRTEITWTIGADVAFLADLDEAHAVSQLAADPRWRVAREEGGLVAVARQAVEGADPPTWSMPWHGYQIGEDRCSRTGLTFEDRTRPWAWSGSEVVSVSEVGSDTHVMRGSKLLGRACRGQMGTALWVQGPIALEIFESGAETDRPHTMQVFHRIQPLREVAYQAKVLGTRGYVAGMLPPGGRRTGHPSMALTPSASGLQLEAWENPGAAGWVWLRVLDERLDPWEEEAVATATLERIGWNATTAEERFLMQGEIPLPEGKGFTGTAEIWFVPDGETAPVRLDSAPIQVPNR